MKTNRFIQSAIAAVIMTLLTFMGMSLLISNKNELSSVDIEFSDFAKVRDMKQPKPIERTKKEIPEHKKLKMPPAAPKLDVTENHTFDREPIPRGRSSEDISRFKDLNSGLGKDIGNDLNLDSGLIAIAVVQPIYPPKAQQQKIEGFATVEFEVNEFGKVSSAKVIESSHRNIFDRAALSAMYKSKFKPFVVDGKAQKVKAVQRFEFKMSQTP